MYFYNYEQVHCNRCTVTGALVFAVYVTVMNSVEVGVGR